MEDKIRKIMADLLGVDPKKITDETSPDNLEAWDSLKQMSLVVSLEEEFGIEFTDDQIAEMMSFKLVCLTVKECLEK